MASRTVADSGTDAPPVCCKDVMAAKGSRAGCHVYECGNCGTVLAIDPDGLIHVINEG